MDISSLPDEMLVSVIKYIKFDELRNLRQISQRIDRVAKRADLGVRIEVTKIVFHSTERKHYAAYYINDAKHHGFSNIVDSTWEDHAELNLRFASVSVLSELHFTGYLDETTFTTIEKQKRSFRHVKKLIFERVCFAPSSSVIKLFMIGLGTSLEEIIFSYNNTRNLEGFVDLEIYSWHTWKRIAFNFQETNNYKLDDNFLLQVAPNCENFSAAGNRSFTVEGTVALLKKCMLENRFSQKFDLGWIVFGNIPNNKVADFFKDEFGSANVIQTDPRPVAYKIRLTNDGKTYDARYFVPVPRV